VYASLLVSPPGLWILPVYFVLIGCYYAATDGVLMALASSLLPERLRGTGLALLVTATSLSRLLASVALGAIWTWIGFEAAVVSFGVGLLLALLLAGTVLTRVKEDTALA
jgi:MFS family permease